MNSHKTVKVIIYHGECFDGFGAACIARSAFREFDTKFFPMKYGDPPPDSYEITGADVYILDFSFPAFILHEMAKKAKHVTLLDHHVSAQRDLDEFKSLSPRNLSITFDMNRSGAGIAWDTFFPGRSRPLLIDYIEDRDLWRFRLPQSKEVHAGLSAFDFDFKIWDELLEGPVQPLAAEGSIILKKHAQDVKAVIRATGRHMKFLDMQLLVVNCPMTMVSDVGEALAKSNALGVGLAYMDTERGRSFSLRSLAHGPDVSELAKVYGGGGHRNAAGFVVPFEQLEKLGLL